MVKFSLKKKNHSGIGRENKSERGRTIGREINKALMEETVTT